jgi:hypothetical protein
MAGNSGVNQRKQDTARLQDFLMQFVVLASIAFSPPLWFVS